MEALASTVTAVFTNVYLLDVPDFPDTMIYGTTEPTSVRDIRHNLTLALEPLVREVAASVQKPGDLRSSAYGGQVFMDDHGSRADLRRIREGGRSV